MLSITLQCGLLGGRWSYIILGALASCNKPIINKEKF